MGKDKTSNQFRPGMITAPCRIVMKSRRVVAGTPEGHFDNAVLIRSVTGEEVVVMMDSVESIWNGLISPKSQAILDEGKDNDADKEDRKNGLQVS